MLICGGLARASHHRQLQDIVPSNDEQAIAGWESI